jgi:hypothetical protein
MPRCVASGHGGANRDHRWDRFRRTDQCRRQSYYRRARGQLADAVSIEFPGRPAVSAQGLASDPAADVALLQVDSVPSA